MPCVRMPHPDTQRHRLAPDCCLSTGLTTVPYRLKSHDPDEYGEIEYGGLPVTHCIFQLMNQGRGGLEALLDAGAPVWPNAVRKIVHTGRINDRVIRTLIRRYLIRLPRRRHEVHAAVACGAATARSGPQNIRTAISAGSASSEVISSSSLTSVTEQPAMSSDVQYSPT